MAKNCITTFFIHILLCSACYAYNTPCVSCFYLKEVGVRELTGNNDGSRVEEYQKNAGISKGQPWCAAFVKWCFDQAGIPTTINGWAASAHNKSNLVWFKQKLIKEPRAGDTFTLYSATLKRISHTGFFHQRINEALYISVEGNTNAGGSRDGDGVYMRKRSFHSTYSISRWTEN